MTWHVAVIAVIIMLGLGVVVLVEVADLLTDMVHLWTTRPRATVFRCPFSARVSLFVDGELATPELEALRSHLPTCEACSEVVEQDIQFAALAARHALQLAEEDEGSSGGPP